MSIWIVSSVRIRERERFDIWIVSSVSHNWQTCLFMCVMVDQREALAVTTRLTDTVYLVGPIAETFMFTSLVLLHWNAWEYWYSVGSNCSQGSYYVQGLRAARLSTVVIRVGSIIIQVPDGLDSTLVISFISISYIYTSNSPCSKLQAPKSVTSLFSFSGQKSDKSIGLGARLQDFYI